MCKKGDPMPRYQPADSLVSPRFTGVRTFARLPHVKTTSDVDAAYRRLAIRHGGYLQSRCTFRS